jgi:hypothetical protein
VLPHRDASVRFQITGDDAVYDFFGTSLQYDLSQGCLIGPGALHAGLDAHSAGGFASFSHIQVT